MNQVGDSRLPGRLLIKKGGYIMFVHVRLERFVSTQKKVVLHICTIPCLFQQYILNS
jgi:hypothetical protein